MRMQVACITRNLRYNKLPLRIDTEPDSAVIKLRRGELTEWYGQCGAEIYTTMNHLVSNSFGNTNYAQYLHVAMRSPAATTSPKAESADECQNCEKHTSSWKRRLNDDPTTGALGVIRPDCTDSRCHGGVSIGSNRLENGANLDSVCTAMDRLTRGQALPLKSTSKSRLFHAVACCREGSAQEITPTLLRFDQYRLYARWRQKILGRFSDSTRTCVIAHSLLLVLLWSVMPPTGAVYIRHNEYNISIIFSVCTFHAI